MRRERGLQRAAHNGADEIAAVLGAGLRILERVDGIGSRIGGGHGRDLATVGGAVAGGFAGHEIQKRHQENNPGYTTVEHRCHTLTSKTSTVVGYDVTYEYDGRQEHVRMDHDPGPRVQVSNGVVVAENGGQSER